MYKKFLCASFCSVLSLGLALGIAPNSQDSSLQSSRALRRNTIASSVAASAFTDAEEITRDDLRVEIKSATATDCSKSIKIEFTSVGLDAFGNSDGTFYSVIDDASYSGDCLNPVLDESIPKPYQFNGYITEIDDTAKSSQTTLYVYDKMTFGSTFVINNTEIKEGSFVSKKGEMHAKTIIIPDAITTIESLAFDFTKALEPYYRKTSDKELDGSKTYYEKVDGNYVEVTTPDAAKLLSYYEQFTNDVEIKCVASAKPSGWAADWTNLDPSKISWGYVPAASEVAEFSALTSSVYMKTVQQPTKYITGYVKTEQVDYYICDGEECGGHHYTPEQIVNDKCPVGHNATLVKDNTPMYNLPLTVKYNVLKESDGTLSRTVEEALPITQTNDKIDEYYNQTSESSFSTTVDIVLEKGEKVDYTSFEFTNIFEGTRVQPEGATKVYDVPDTSKVYKAKAIKRFDREIDLSEILKCNYKGLKTFGNETVITMNVDKVKPYYYLQNFQFSSAMQEKYNDGEYTVRYTLSNLSNSYYRITYVGKDGSLVTKTLKLITPEPVVILEKDSANDVSFLINNKDVGSDFSADKLRRFELIGFTVNMHLWNEDGHNKVTKSELMIKFGALDVLPEASGKVAYFDAVLFVVLFAVGFTVLYGAGAFALFKYETEKFKNDEFRRVKPKLYLKKALLGYLGSIVVALTILFIIIRFGIFNNSIAVHNATDVFVVLGGIVSVVIIGYFIKYIVDVTKANKKRKEAKRLRLSDDVADDGTN